MTKMRAVLIKGGHGPIENLHIGETDRPVPKKGQVLVKVCTYSHLDDLTDQQAHWQVRHVLDCRVRPQSHGSGPASG